MKTYINKTFIILLFCLISQPCLPNEKVKIGLLVPLTGEYSEIGKSIINSVRLALISINNPNIEVLPKDSGADPEISLKASKDLYENHNVKIIIGPVFNHSNKLLNKIPYVTFLSFTNKMTEKYPNVISSGVNALSQINAIKKFQEENELKRTLFLIPNSKYKSEIEKAISLSKINFKDKFIYDTDPTLLTAQIEKITRYKQRKQNLIDEINRLEKSNEENKEKKIESLERRDTLGGINFDSVVITDFDENLKSVATSLLYTDVSSKRVTYITLNQWFDDTLTEELSLQPIYFPSINKENYEDFIRNYKIQFKKTPNQLSFLSYDLMGLVYYLIYKNNFSVNQNIFYEKNKFIGKIGVFEIDKNTITHELNFYSVDEQRFKKIF